MTKRIKYLVLIFITLLSFPSTGNGQKNWSEKDPVADSLFMEVFKNQYKNPDSALVLCNRIENYLSDKSDPRSDLFLIEFRGNIWWHKGNLQKSLDIYLHGLKKAKEAQDTLMIANFSGDAGYLYSEIRKQDSAYVYLVRAINLAEKMGNERKKNIFNSFLASHYNSMGRFEKSLSIYKRMITDAQKNRHEVDIEGWYNNIALCYSSLNKLDSARYYYEKAIEIVEKKGDLNRLGTSRINLGNLHIKKGEYEKGIALLKKAVNNFEKVGNDFYLCSCYLNIGEGYYKAGDYTNARTYQEKTVECSKELENLSMITKAYYSLAKIHSATGSFEKAFEYQTLYSGMKDSLRKRENRKALNELEVQYENEKKEKEIALLHKQQELKEAEIDRQKAEVRRANIQRLALGSGFVLVLIFSFFTFRNLKQKQKLNKKLVRQKGEIENKNKALESANFNITRQKEQIEEKSQEILDSINYAKRLQEAILPPKSLVNDNFKNNFIFYQPKDIVAGDFYWMEQVEKMVFFAAADCTGHGVPGAMVSVVCSNALSKAVIEEGIIESGKILDRTRELVIERFGRSQEQIKDGMDIALCVFNKDNSMLSFSGAHNPLWIIKKGERSVKEVKGDKQPIGRYATETPFSSHELRLHKGDSLYLFSDGFQDQFGGSKRKKYKSVRLKEFLLSIKDEPMEKQKALLKEEFEAWKGDLDQLDDVCVMGIRI